MKKIQLQIEDVLYEFYKKVRESAGGISPEQVMADALFRLAGGLSIELEKRRDFQDKAPIRPERKTGTAAK